MGTDRTEYVLQPCPCGKGEVYVDHCLPEHSWSPGAYWWEMGVRCKDCREKYEIVEIDKKAILQEKGDQPKVIEELCELTQRAFYGPDYKGLD